MFSISSENGFRQCLGRESVLRTEAEILFGRTSSIEPNWERPSRWVCFRSTSLEIASRGSEAGQTRAAMPITNRRRWNVPQKTGCCSAAACRMGKNANSLRLRVYWWDLPICRESSVIDATCRCPRRAAYWQAVKLQISVDVRLIVGWQHRLITVTV